VADQKEREPEDGQSGKTFVCHTITGRLTKFLENRPVLGIVLPFVVLHEFILQVVVNKDGRKVGVITFAVAVDGPVPTLVNVLESQEKTNVDQQDKLGGVFVKVLHAVYLMLR
jgi:hypothetical protein